jgi:hypothetical protein
MRVSGQNLSQRNEPEAFFPTGAIASCILMVLGYAGLWFVLYVLLASRG